MKHENSVNSSREITDEIEFLICEIKLDLIGTSNTNSDRV
jgi:hypothetical protein